MTDEVFLKEMLEYLKESFAEFSGYRNEVWDIFCCFNLLCQKNDINYYFAFGTLIGAIRDQGGIPWDYDIDVLVSIDDRNRLIKVIKEQLPEMFYYVYSDKEKEYPASCLRICKKGFPFTSIHLDVFFAIGCPKEKPQDFVMNVKKLSDIRAAKYSDKWFPNNSSSPLIKRILRYVWNIKNQFITAKTLVNEEDKLYFKYKLKDSRYFCIPGDPYLHYYYTEDFCKSGILRIKGQNVRIPKGYDRFLKTIYGDYWNYPTIRIRFNEFYNMLKIVRERQQQYSNTNIFDAYK